MTAITNQAMLNPWAAYSAGTADFVWTAGTTTPGVGITCTGKQVILVNNTNVGTQTVTIVAQDDEQNRAESITTYSLAAADFAVFGVGLTNSKGWKKTDGTIMIYVSDVSVKIAVLTLPDGYP